MPIAKLALVFVFVAAVWFAILGAGGARASSPCAYATQLATWELADAVKGIAKMTIHTGALQACVKINATRVAIAAVESCNDGQSWPDALAQTIVELCPTEWPDERLARGFPPEK